MKQRPAGYHKADLDKLTSPEQLDQLLTVTTPRAWSAQAAAAVIFVAGTVWGFGGRVVDAVPGDCVLVSSAGTRDIVFEYSGRITDIRPEVGDLVKRRQVVARLEQPHLVEQINALLGEREALLAQGVAEDAEAVRALTDRIEQLRDRLELESRVVSPYEGRVQQLRVEKFAYAQPGTPLLTLELSGDQIRALEAVIYLPVEAGRLVHTGMPVRIMPNDVRKEEYGYMTGRVYTVSEFPVSPDDIRRVVGSDELVRYLSRGATLIEVRAELDMDSETYSGFRWSSSDGPHMKIEAGTLCRADVTTGERTPFSLLFGGA